MRVFTGAIKRWTTTILSFEILSCYPVKRVLILLQIALVSPIEFSPNDVSTTIENFRSESPVRPVELPDPSNLRVVRSPFTYITRDTIEIQLDVNLILTEQLI